MYLVINFHPTQQIQQIIAFHYGYCNMFRHTSHHQANFEPLNIFEFLLTVLFVLKAADPCVSSGWPSVLVQLGSCSAPLEVKAAPRQKAIHYLHMGQQPSKQKEL
jgi:hypothetical protein